MPFHLTKNQRIELSLLRQIGYSMRSAATVLGVSPSMVSRELRRNQAPREQPTTGQWQSGFASLDVLRPTTSNTN
jgi:IS30 family transposase